MQVTYLVPDNPLSADRGSVVRLAVSVLDINRVLVTTAPGGVSLQLVDPNGLQGGLLTLLGGQVKAGAGALGTALTPLGSFYYDMDASQPTWNLAGLWRGVWKTTTPTGVCDFRFHLVDAQYS